MHSHPSRWRWPALWCLAFAATIPAHAQTNVLSATITYSPNVGTTTAATSINCNTNTGPTNFATVVVKAVSAPTGSNSIVVSTSSVGAGLLVTPPSNTTLTSANNAAGLAFTVRIANGCAGTTVTTTPVARTFRFNAGANGDVTVSLPTLVTAGTTSPLSTPSSISLVCTRTAGPTFTPGPAATLAVRSNATFGTPFTVDSTGSFAPPSWLSLSAMSGLASTTPANLSLVPAAGCGGFALGSTTTATIRLLSAPAPERQVTVSLQIVSPTPLTATPGSGVISYTKNSGLPGRLDVLIGSANTPAPFITVDTASLPAWLTVDTLSGAVPRSIRFSTTSAADTMVPGSYNTTVRIRTSGFADLTVPLTLQLNNPPPRLSISDGLTRNITWTVGSPIPTPSITLVSSDSPISYTLDTGGPLAPIVAAANQRGLAYSFGTVIPITFNPNIFAAAQPGSTLTGTVSVTWGTPSSTLTVTFNVTVAAPGATITSMAPASLPTAAPGQTFTVSLSGTSFVPSVDPAFRTRVGIVQNNAIVLDSSITANVVNVSNMILTITVPATTNTNLPFALSGNGGTVMLGVCNPDGTTCTTPTGTAVLTIGSNPIVEAVTSASSFQQVSAPTLQTVAPFDVLSVFGANFCSSGGRGCSSSDVLYGVPDAITGAYPLFVSPDAAGASQRRLSVVFQTRATPPVVLGTGAILFATNSQINVMVPEGISAQIGNSIDMVVNFGFGTGATMLSSTPQQLSVVAANPGLFTVAANGMGDGAILDTRYNLISSANEAAMRSTASNSDTVQIYLTGLGVPNSSANNASAGSGFTWSADCISLASYLTSLSSVAGSTISSADGLVIRSSLLNSNRLTPCFSSTASSPYTPPTATIGGVAGTVTYAGLVADSFVGLYQVNVRLPGSGAGPFTRADGTTLSAITSPVQLPVVVTHAGRSSQAGVNIWVRRRLLVTAPTTLTGQVGVVWSTSNNAVTAAQGTQPYRFAITSGLLPAGLSMNTSTGAITGTPVANTSGTYQITVTATDSANFPITGTVSFTLTVAGGLFATTSSPAPFSGTFGTAESSLTTVTAAGGTFPYTYALTGPSPLPAGISIDSATGVLGISNSLPAGTYQVAVTATDASSTPLTGTANFDVVVALLVANTTPVDGANGTASTITTVSATGNTGAVTYTLDATSAALGWLSINPNTGVVSITNAAPAGTTRQVTVTATAASSATGASAAGTGSRTFTVTIAP